MFESACIGYLGRERDITRAPNSDAPALGTLSERDTILLYHEPASIDGAAYSFVSGVIRDGNLIPLLGWIEGHIVGEECEEIAG